mgnify:CR=1 FL=1
MSQITGYIFLILLCVALIFAGVVTFRFFNLKADRSNFPAPPPPTNPYTQADILEWRAACRQNLRALMRTQALLFTPRLAGITMVVIGFVGLLLIATGGVRIV